MENSLKQLKPILPIISEIPRWIVLFNLGEEAEVWHDDYLLTIKQSKDFYYTRELPKVLKAIKDFQEENKEFARECRLRKKKELKKKFKKIKTNIEQDPLNNKNKIKTLYKIANELDNRVTQEMIDRATKYPIENIIEVNSKGFAKCVNHNDKHPSMFCKNNFAYCFSCGWSGNTIQLYRKIHKCGFAEAVRRLQ